MHHRSSGPVLTLIEDFTVGIIAGCVLAAAFAIFDRLQRQANR
jgi:MFS superfamily sulfate permease-like transporter